MAKSKFSKKALISVFSIIVCLSLLIGSTFAWFTDVATSGENKIVAGNLDVELEYTTDFTEWNKVEDSTKLFKEDTLWEPGHTEVVYLRIRNAGTLAFDYTLNVFAADEKSGISMKDDSEFFLSNGLMFALSTSDAAPTAMNREEAKDVVKAGTYTLNTESAKEVLAPDSSEYVTLVVYMPEEIGNEYNYKTGTEAPFIDLRLLVEATQATVESDSFDNTYDENANGTPDHPEFDVSTVTELVDALQNAEAGDVINVQSGSYTLSENIATNGSLVIKEGQTVTLDLAGNSISATASGEAKPAPVLNNGDLIIENAILESMDAATNAAAVHNSKGNLTLINCIVRNVSPTAKGQYALVVDGGHVTAIDCTIEGYRGGIALSNDGSITMNGGSVTATYYYPIYTLGTGNSSFNGTTFVKQNHTKGKAISYNAFKADEGTAVFTDCEFKSETASAISFDIGGVYTGYTFNNCTYTNVKAPV